MREDKRFELEVHVAPLCFRENDGHVEVLIAKRAPTRKIYPSKWGCGGGQVRPGENFTEAVKRQAKEEFDIDIEVISPYSAYEIDTPTLTQKKIPGIQFVCRVIGQDPKVASQEHTEWKWQRVSDLHDIDLLSNLKQVIPEAAKLFR